MRILRCKHRALVLTEAFGRLGRGYDFPTVLVVCTPAGQPHRPPGPGCAADGARRAEPGAAVCAARRWKPAWRICWPLDALLLATPETSWLWPALEDFLTAPHTGSQASLPGLTP